MVYRKKCPGCKRQFSLLPNDVIPLHSYGLTLINERLAATVAGESYGSRGFYEQHELVPDETADNNLRGQSWSDLMSESPPCPSPQLFRHWSRKWPARAQEWLDSLLLTCLSAGCDLKERLAERLVGFTSCPAPMHPLLIAAGLVSLLARNPDWFRLTVQLLAFRPSHKIFRAAGRPPPQYGGALTLTTARELREQQMEAPQ